MVSYIFQRRQYLEKAIRFRSQGMSLKEISKIIPVSEETIRRWCIKFAPELDGTVPMTKKKRTISTTPDGQQSCDTKALERRIKELENKLAKESLRADFYEEMINVAESKFNIPIRKKAGIKQ